MAHPSQKLVNALRKTADNLRNGAHYAWGHHGSCNCGNLLGVVTQLSSQQILSFAHTGTGEWTELAVDYCPVSEAPVDMLISSLEKLGLTPSDIHNLEYLEDKSVLKNLPGGFKWLKKNKREDVIVYFETFATMLEQKLTTQLPVVSFRNTDMDWINTLTLQHKCEQVDINEPVTV